MKAILYLSLSICILFSPSIGQCQDVATKNNAAFISKFENLDKNVEALLDSFHTAGLAVAIVKKNKTIYTKGFGYRDIQNKVKAGQRM